MSFKVQALTASFTFGVEPKAEFSADVYTIGAKPMSWNYRIVMEPKNETEKFSENFYTIREVFYDEDGEITFWSDDGACTEGTTYAEIAEDFKLQGEAFDRPALKIEKDEEGNDCLVEFEIEDEDAESSEDEDEDADEDEEKEEK
jgi:hypothetical protein